MAWHMSRAARAVLMFVVLLGTHHAARADALTPALNPLDPSANQDTPRAVAAAPVPLANRPRCTIATIVEDISTNDAYLGRTRFVAPDAPAPGQPALCPAGAAQEALRRTLEACKQHTSNSYNCVYGDMDRMFDVTTDMVDTSAVDSQCPSFSAKFIGIACQPGLAEDVCNVACGASAAEAIEAARKKCTAKHDGQCAVTNAVPVQAP
jgi:hypothetical protein